MYRKIIVRDSYSRIIISCVERLNFTHMIPGMFPTACIRSEIAEQDQTDSLDHHLDWTKYDTNRHQVTLRFDGALEMLLMFIPNTHSPNPYPSRWIHTKPKLWPTWAWMIVTPLESVYRQRDGNMNIHPSCLSEGRVRLSPSRHTLSSLQSLLLDPTWALSNSHESVRAFLVADFLRYLLRLRPKHRVKPQLRRPDATLTLNTSCVLARR